MVPLTAEEKRQIHYVTYIFLPYMFCRVFFLLDDCSFFFLAMGISREGAESPDNHPYHFLSFA